MFSSTYRREIKEKKSYGYNLNVTSFKATKQTYDDFLFNS